LRCIETSDRAIQKTGKEDRSDPRVESAVQERKEEPVSVVERVELNEMAQPFAM
jgi:hypothetical protein